ncbi:hypothetical protein IWW57_003187 [Coemansia sp. S610]|nr:hypothetical protein IWW57_003187 [Coemansia sp. S610]
MHGAKKAKCEYKSTGPGLPAPKKAEWREKKASGGRKAGRGEGGLGYRRQQQQQQQQHGQRKYLRGMLLLVTLAQVGAADPMARRGVALPRLRSRCSDTPFQAHDGEGRELAGVRTRWLAPAVSAARRCLHSPGLLPSASARLN